MKTKITAFDVDSRTVDVLFTHGKIKHRRRVNACLTDGGDYDEAATEARVADVARGVLTKIEAGVIA
jgi:hypothetical protein